MLKKILTSLTLIAISSASLFASEPFTPQDDIDALKKVKIKHDKSLPNVLLWGDSISIGYTRYVIPMLAGKANVSRIKGNSGDTNRGLKSIKKWLGKKKWDVIHFNHGLHDLCYRHPQSKVQGNRDKKKGTMAVPLEQYEKNLETIVLELKKTGAKLIWASTSVVPEKEAGRFVEDAVKYNAAAKKIMDKHGIAINDLHALTTAFDKSLFIRVGDVHFKDEGYAKIAKQVAIAIEQEL